MIDHSYDLVFNKLIRKIKENIEKNYPRNLLVHLRRKFINFLEGKESL
jgi:hypothetical protein